MYTLDIELPGLPRTENRMFQGNWRARHFENKKWKTAVIENARLEAPLKPLKKAKLTLIRYSSRQPDYDNLVKSFKPIVDGLKGLVITDDDPSIVGYPTYKWEKTSPTKGRIRVIVKGE